MTEPSTKCDQCGREKSAVNDWLEVKLRLDAAGVLHVRIAPMGAKPRRGWLTFCGKPDWLEWFGKNIERWMNPQIAPIAPIQSACSVKSADTESR